MRVMVCPSACFFITFSILLLSSLTNAQQNCTKCGDGSYSCCGTTHCCPYDTDGEWMCCTGDESCCKGVCCITQTTFCCKAENGHPDRCCPRWSLCCPSGEFGCCTPMGDPWTPTMGDGPFFYPSPPSRLGRRRSSEGTLEHGLWKAKLAEAASVVYALFVEGSDFHALTIDPSTGSLIQDVKVTGFDNHGEITRSFAFDQKRELFYYVEADFASDPETNLTLTTVNPSTGKATRVSIQGTNNKFPTGYYYHCSLDKLFIATQPFDNQTTANFTFYTVNVTTAVATQISTISVAGDGLYSGWFHAISDDGTLAYRLGYKDVLNAANPGLGITKISSSTASTTWQQPIPVPTSHDFYLTGSIHPLSTTTFLSLAPRSGLKDGGLDLVSWSYQPSSSVIVASLGPDSNVNFGPIGEALSCDHSVYAGVLYLHGSVPVQDKWVLVTVNVQSGAVQQVPIAKLLGETTSISGIGIPFTSSLV